VEAGAGEEKLTSMQLKVHWRENRLGRRTKTAECGGTISRRMRIRSARPAINCRRCQTLIRKRAKKTI